jgi:hypothetical protein
VLLGKEDLAWSEKRGVTFWDLTSKVELKASVFWSDALKRHFGSLHVLFFFPDSKLRFFVIA